MIIGYLQRKAAWEILLKVSSGDFSDHALDKVLKNYQFNPLDIAFITELSFGLSLIHISEPTRQAEISYAVFCLKKKKYL